MMNIKKIQTNFYIKTRRNEDYWLKKYFIDLKLKSSFDETELCYIISKNDKIISKVPLYFFKELDHMDIIDYIEQSKNEK